MFKWIRRVSLTLLGCLSVPVGLAMLFMAAILALGLVISAILGGGGNGGGSGPGGSPIGIITPFPSLPGEESPSDFAVISPAGEVAIPIAPDNYKELLPTWTGNRSVCGVPFGISTGLTAQESTFGRNRNDSSAGAQGPYQFLPTTWYNPVTNTGWGINPLTGRLGNIRDPRDAGPAADRYLCYLLDRYGRDRNGNPLTWAQAIRRAIFYYGGSAAREYDPNDDEVVFVMRYARLYSMPAPTASLIGKVGGWDWEVRFAFLGPYGNAQFNERIPYHRGVDLAIAGAPNNGFGRQVRAFYPGVVRALTHDPAGGNGVIIWVPNLGVYNRYFHWNSVNVSMDQVVTTDTVLGQLGETGSLGFPHLHFEVSRGINGDDIVNGALDRGLINPMPFVYAQVPLPAQQMAQNSGGT